VTFLVENFLTDIGRSKKQQWHTFLILMGNHRLIKKMEVIQTVPAQPGGLYY